MIDITIHIDRLELLKEYMNLWIDGRGKVIEIDYNVFDTVYTTQDIFNFIHGTGMLLYSGNSNKIYKENTLSFEQWLELRNQN
jgi:hypothetical protein